MKAEDLKTKTPDELKKLLLDTRKEQFNQRFQRTNGQLEKTAEIRTLRRQIARIKTFMNMNDDNKAAAKAKAPAKAKAAKPAAKKAAKG
jgi:large subunit ribosomal protein L29